jgi:ubiquitin thioesterase protein OTUB1
MGDKFKFAEEETRLKSLHNILNQYHQEDLYEQFADDTFELMQELAASVSVVDGSITLLTAFNDDNRSKSIMTYIKARFVRCSLGKSLVKLTSSSA